VEFVINNVIGVHPRAILEFDQISAKLREEISRRARGYASPRAFYVESSPKASPPSPPRFIRSR